MRKSILSCFALGFLVIVSRPVLSDDVDVFFITGQSNAGNVGELNGTGSTDVGFNLRFGRVEDRNPSGGMTDLTDVIEEFSSNFLNTNMAVTELALGLHDQNDMAIYSFARNGRPLANSNNDSGESWFPGADPANGDVFNDELYGAFVLWANARLNEIIADGDTPVVKGIFWFQGEGDVGIGTSATDAYQTNYENYLFRLRQDFGSQVIVVSADIRSVGNSAVMARQAQVNEALANVAAADALAEAVPTQDLPPRSAGDVHYTNGAYFVLAGRWAAAFNGEEPDPGDDDDNVPGTIASFPVGTSFGSFTRIFADTDFAGGNVNHGRGNLFSLGDNADGDQFRIDSIGVRKSSLQTFTNCSLTLWLFEGTEAQWNAGDGDSDGDLFDGTGIVNIPVDAEVFELDGTFNANDIIQMELPQPVMVDENSDYGFIIQYSPSAGNSPFVQLSETLSSFGGQTRMLDVSQEARPERGTEFLVFGEAVLGVIVGDVNQDGNVDLLDVGPFVSLLSNGDFQAEADINGDGVVDLLDVGPFVDLLSS